MTEDRWEAFGDYDDDRKFNQGVIAERERIIALINSCEVGGYPDAEFIVALIKEKSNA